jgi:hypothetical protein
MKTMRTISFAVAVILAVSLNASAVITEVDLTTENSFALNIDGADFYQSCNVGPTGTGNFEPFVRLDAPGSPSVKEGYNTDGVTEFETKDDNQWTHSIQLGDIPIVDGKYEFRLDINQNVGNGGEFLSLDELKIHLVPEATGGSLSGYDNTYADFGDFGSPAWQLSDDYFIKLDYKLESGSGDGDMCVYIPLTGNATDYVYLYSKFGENYANNDGFEEWGIATVPEPATMVILGLGSVLLRKRK